MFLIFELKCVCRNEVSRGEAVSISTILSNSTLFEYYLTVEILDSDRLSEILSISCCSESLSTRYRQPLLRNGLTKRTT